MREVRQQRRQLTSILNRQCALKEELLLVKRPKDPSDTVLRALRQCVVAAMPRNVRIVLLCFFIDSFIDQLAMRAALTPAGDEEQTKDVATSAEGPAYRTLTLNVSFQKKIIYNSQQLTCCAGFCAYQPDVGAVRRSWQFNNTDR